MLVTVIIVICLVLFIMLTILELSYKEYNNSFLFRLEKFFKGECFFVREVNIKLFEQKQRKRKDIDNKRKILKKYNFIVKEVNWAIEMGYDSKRVYFDNFQILSYKKAMRLFKWKYPQFSYKISFDDSLIEIWLYKK